MISIRMLVALDALEHARAPAEWTPAELDAALKECAHALLIERVQSPSARWRVAWAGEVALEAARLAGWRSPSVVQDMKKAASDAAT